MENKRYKKKKSRFHGLHVKKIETKQKQIFKKEILKKMFIYSLSGLLGQAEQKLVLKIFTKKIFFYGQKSIQKIFGLISFYREMEKKTSQKSKAFYKKKKNIV